MIQIKDVAVIPRLPWSSWSQEEFMCGNVAMMERRTVRMVQGSFDDDPLFILGLIYSSLTSPPFVWFLMTDAFFTNLLRNLRAMREAVMLLPPAHALVNAQFKQGCRFAEFFGFRCEGEVARVDGREYALYRRG